jgi:hypothetical protein
MQARCSYRSAGLSMMLPCLHVARATRGVLLLHLLRLLFFPNDFGRHG